MGLGKPGCMAYWTYFIPCIDACRYHNRLHTAGYCNYCCVVHGCTVGDNSIIGMGSIILNGSVIPKNCIVSAGSVVNSKLKAEEGDLIAGSPARVIKKLSEKHWEYLEYASGVYLAKIDRFKNQLEEIKLEEK